MFSIFQYQLVVQNKLNAELPPVHVTMSFIPSWANKLLGAKTIQIIDPVDSSLIASELNRSYCIPTAKKSHSKMFLRKILFNSATLHRLVAPKTVDILENLENFRKKPGDFFGKILKRMSGL